MTHSAEDDRLKENIELPSPTSTSVSIVVADEKQKFLVSSPATKAPTNFSQLWTQQIPYGILTVSILQITFFLAADDNLQKLLRFEPTKLHQLWRFITYMFLHEDWIHLILNVFMQVLFACFLEVRHGKLRVLLLYSAGGITGVFGASCFHPDLVIGASGGVYALLISHVADVMTNFESIDCKVHRCTCIAIIVISDVAYNTVHVLSRDEPLISWGAHAIAGVSGLFLGLVLYKRDEGLARTRKLCLFWTGLAFHVILLISLMILVFQIKKCTPPDLVRVRYVYIC